MSKGMLVFTDFHAHIWREFSKPDIEYVTDRFKMQVDALNKMLDYATKNKLDVLFGGDMFHKRGAVDTRVYNAVFSAFASHDKIENIYLIAGNHDMVNNRLGAPSSLDSFNVISNVTVINTPMHINNEKAEFFLLPYGEDTDKIIDILHKWSKEARNITDKPTIFSSHLGINGAKQGATTHRLASIFSAKDIDPEAYTFVYLGHYHERQEIYNDKDGYTYQNEDNKVKDKNTFTHEAIYGGSTIPVSFSDEDQIKGYDVIDYNLPMTRAFHKVKAPKFVTLNKWNKTLATKHKNDYIRLQLPKKEATKVAKEETENTGIRVEAQTDFSVKTRIPVEAKDSPEQVTKKYTEKFYPELEKDALEIIKEVSQID